MVICVGLLPWHSLNEAFYIREIIIEIKFNQDKCFDTYKQI